LVKVVYKRFGGVSYHTTHNLELMNVEIDVVLASYTINIIP